MAVPDSDNAILIAGGGIAGLSAAIALGRTGRPVRLFERSKSFAKNGAGIQLGPNATKILRSWGVLDALEKKLVRAEGIGMGDGISGDPIARVRLGDYAEERFGAPYVLVNRAHLHSALLEAASALPMVEIETGVEITGFEQFPGELVVETSKSAIRGSVLIGADGIWSSLRQQVDPTAVVAATEQTAWRATLSPSALPEELRGPWTGLWMAPNAHLVHYPVNGGKQINLVAVVTERWTPPEAGWDQEADVEVLKQFFMRWDDRLQTMIAEAANWRKWSIYDLPPMRRSSIGYVVLLGDAAHPVFPFLAQGGALAIEDAAVLANTLDGSEPNLAIPLGEFEQARIARTARTRYESRRMGQVYHMSGLSRRVRDFVLRRKSPEALLDRFDWLYGFEAG